MPHHVPVICPACLSYARHMPRLPVICPSYAPLFFYAFFQHLFYTATAAHTRGCLTAYLTFPPAPSPRLASAPKALQVLGVYFTLTRQPKREQGVRENVPINPAGSSREVGDVPHDMERAYACVRACMRVHRGCCVCASVPAGWRAYVQR